MDNTLECHGVSPGISGSRLELSIIKYNWGQSKNTQAISPPQCPAICRAERNATAWTVKVELTQELVGNTLGPPMMTLGTSCSCAYSLVTEAVLSLPMMVPPMICCPPGGLCQASVAPATWKIFTPRSAVWRQSLRAWSSRLKLTPRQAHPEPVPVVGQFRCGWWHGAGIHKPPTMAPRWRLPRRTKSCKALPNRSARLMAMPSRSFGLVPQANLPLPAAEDIPVFFLVKARPG